ncbi:NAD(P)-dependent oxidoreductase [Poseidonocella sedimentorum]|uniref:3-hydroxyisobutyrate dehydrogenase n=1 Tax=Poseidonocella sedimentorum TaxID=871652 RepID=A0A1I6DA38_9RHOB|nr:DUF1932 domain-containing protein [Poseidonocella sedimentorum]SFR02182.1 3-hydroxyisobutyrate dehydrogenase [Poseidonocella sedimentorum]
MRIAFIGLGEAGSALTQGFGPDRAGDIATYDIKLDDPATAPEIEDRCARLGIAARPSLAEALAGAELIFSTVTADQAVAVAEAAAPHLAPDALWCDLNSCAPASKQAAAGIVEAAGGRYVDVAVMAPVHPKLNMVPLLVSGPHAGVAVPLLESLPMAPKLVEGPVGRASSIKMIRSVMVKGIEALTAECALAAVAAGVETEVFASLNRSHPGKEWSAQAAYNFERSLVHGARRAAEMEEVAKTLRDLGLPDRMASATVDWQRQIAETGLPAPGAEATVREIAEGLLAVLRG